MKKIMPMLLLAVATVVMTSCGGAPAKSASVSLDELDDFCTVKSYTLESDAQENGIGKLDNVKGTLTLVIKRNKNEMKYKPSDVCSAQVKGEISASSYYVFKGDCDAVVKKIVKMEPGTEETFTIGIKGIDPYNKYNSEEENKQNRQNAFDALTKKGCLDQICFNIDFKKELIELMNALKELDDEDDD